MAKNKQFFGDYPPFLLLEGIYGSIDKKRASSSERMGDEERGVQLG